MSAELIGRARSGDDAALEQLLYRHDKSVRDAVQAAIPARWRSLIGPDDVMQQSWLDAFLSVASLAADDEPAFSAWFRRIAENNLRDALRRLEADKRGGSARAVEYSAGESTTRTLVGAIFGVDSRTPTRIAREQEAESALRAALDALPPDYRQAVQLHDLDGRPIREIAEILGRSEGAVHMLRSRAHEQLREILTRKNAAFRDFA